LFLDKRITWKERT